MEDFKLTIRLILAYLIIISLSSLLIFWGYWTWIKECSNEPWVAIFSFILITLWGFRAENNREILLRILIGGIAILLGMTLVWYIINVTICAKEAPPSVAVEFFLDTSSNMMQEVNGHPRSQIALDAIDEIYTQLDTVDAREVWRGVRVAGGGEQCNQTRQITSGSYLSKDRFLAPLENITFSGTNAYEAGISGLTEDFVPLVGSTDIRVAILLVGSLDYVPCQTFQWGERLRIMHQMGIDATLCIFALDVDLTTFDNFRNQVSQEFTCVYNVDNSEEITRRTIGIIEELILQEQGEIEILITPTPIVYVASPTPSLTTAPTNTSTATRTPSPPTPTRTPTDTPVPPSPTRTPSDTPVPPSPTRTPSDTPVPPSPTRTPSDTPVPPSPTRTPTDTPVPTPTLSGQIVFRRGVSYELDGEIFVLDLASGQETKLTTVLSNDEPEWSPDGSQIAFMSNRDNNDWEIYVMDADGSNVRRLTNRRGEDWDPSWSPDGRQIAFTSIRNGNMDIYTMNADGSNVQQLTTDSAFDWFPAWSPDGRQIAFTSQREGGNLFNQIYVMNADGSEQHNLTNQRIDGTEPAWSPDGSKIAFSSDVSSIYAMSADGSDLQRLADGSSPAWSPDGTLIVFYALKSDRTDYELYVMDADGSNRRVISILSAFSPHWRPIP